MAWNLFGRLLVAAFITQMEVFWIWSAISLGDTQEAGVYFALSVVGAFIVVGAWTYALVPEQKR